MRNLIVYYSFEGTTKKVAEELAKLAEGDLYEVVPVKELQTKGFYKYVWGGRQAVFGKTPPIQEPTIDFNAYDRIFIGTPIWAGTYAPPIKTLLEGEYIKGKSVAYFYTHEGGPGKAQSKGQAAIEAKNTCIGSLDLKNPVKHWDETVDKLKTWLTSL